MTLEERIQKGEPFYISVTGLRLKHFWSVFPFARFAFFSFRSAKRAEGNLYAAVKNVNGVQHTLTAWESKKSMQAFVYRGIHLKAIQSFRKYFTGKTYGYEGTTLPTWQEVHQIIKDKGIEYGPTP